MVYVGRRKYPYGSMKMSHMVSDNLQELHDMAEKLGIRRYFQDKPGKPHYDVCQRTKQRAITLGAREANEQTILKVLRSLNG